MNVILLVVALVASLAVAAFCAGVETGFLSVSRGRLTHLAREGSEAAKIVAAALSNMSLTLTGLLVGNNLAAVVYSSASAALAAALFPESAAMQSLWSVGAAFAILYLGEFLPKLFCSKRPLKRVIAASRAYRLFELLTRPAAVCATAVTGIFLKRRATKEKLTVNDLMRILSDRKNGVRLTDFESALIGRILVLRRKGMFITPEAVLAALDDGE